MIKLLHTRRNNINIKFIEYSHTHNKIYKTIKLRKQNKNYYRYLYQYFVTSIIY